jgi:DNA-binding transcriptional MerR regulator
VRLKKFYSAREVAALTGLTARQLQWWDARRLVQPAVAPRRTEAGGFTERRYTPVELIELMVLADLRRRGVPVSKLRRLVDTLRRRFGVRLFEAIGSGGGVTLFTDGHDVYARTAGGAFYNLFRNPDQPLLLLGGESPLKELTARARRARPRRRKTPAAAGRGGHRDTAPPRDDEA